MLGTVGASGIGWELVRAVNLVRRNQALGVTLVIFVMVLAAETISRRLQRHTEGASVSAVA